MLEKRRFVRIPDSLKISYRLMPALKVKDYLTKDISQGGVRFFLHEFVPRGSLLKITIAFEKIHFSLEALAKVAWVSEDSFGQRFEAGVEFVEIPQDAARYLIKYIGTFTQAMSRL